jgi:hypothetical protein
MADLYWWWRTLVLLYFTLHWSYNRHLYICCVISNHNRGTFWAFVLSTQTSCHHWMPWQCVSVISWQGVNHDVVPLVWRVMV